MEEFFAELKRRRMYRVGASYAVIAWGITQFVDVLSQIFALPAWIGQPILLLLALGLPITLIVAWMIEGRMRAGGPAMRRPRSFVDWGVFGGIAVAVALIGYYGFVGVQSLMVAGEPEIADGPGHASIAVLPFNNLSADPENASLADGVHDDLLTQLAKIHSLKVISRTSVMGYRGTTMNLREIAQQLGVANILEGGVQRAGDALRINVQLIRADTDEHVWAETYDRNLTAENIFAIQSEMAVAITSALRANLLPEEIERLNEVPTANTAAYEAYISGNDFFDSGDYAVDIPRAVDAYQRAVDADPEFALAWAGLSRAHSMMYWFYLDRTDARVNAAREAVERAFAAAPELPEAHMAMGDFHYRSARDYARALSEYSIAAEGLPGDSTVPEQIGYIYRRLGDWDRAVELLAQAAELDPRNVTLLIEQGSTQLALRNYAEADGYFARAIEIDPENVNAYEWRSFIPLYRDGDIAAHRAILSRAPGANIDSQYFLDWLGAIYGKDYDTAISVLDGWEVENHESIVAAEREELYGVTHRLAGRNEDATVKFSEVRARLEAMIEAGMEDPSVYVTLGEALAGLGESEAAIAAGQRAMALLPASIDAMGGPQYQLDAVLRVFIPAGDFALAVSELDSYLATRGAMWSIEGLLPDPRLDAIRTAPEFVALVEKYRAR